VRKIQTINNIEQRSEEWFKLRIGSIGGSDIKKVMTGGKGKTRQSLMYELASEIISGKKIEKKPTLAMMRGTELEPDAIEEFEFVSGLTVKPIGLILGSREHTHASPDGDVSDGGILEVKCRTSPVHLQHLNEGVVPKDDVYQVQWQLGISGRPHCWYYTYHPDLHPLIIRVKPDKDTIDELFYESEIFIKEMLEIVNRWNNK
jgi:putative phage-type endonuclease